MMSVINLTEEQIKQLLDWPTVCDAVEQSFRAICEIRVTDDQPISNQPARTLTRTEKGILFSMPGFIGNYKLSTLDRSKSYNSLGCKLVTAFSNNDKLNPPKPNILANILLFNEKTGELKATLQACEITAWRTAAASLVATNFLYSKRETFPKINTLAILGSGVQGRIHGIGFCVTSDVQSIYIWNRTKIRAETLATELNQLRQTFQNPNVNIVCADSVEECVRDADVIVTATFTDTPLLHRSMIKTNVHINAVGAGKHHHSEISEDIYTAGETKIYVDSNIGARSELKTLNAPIVGEVGDIVNGHSKAPSVGITIFHSMGLALQDVSVGEAILEKFQNNK